MTFSDVPLSRARCLWCTFLRIEKAVQSVEDLKTKAQAALAAAAAGGARQRSYPSHPSQTAIVGSAVCSWLPRSSCSFHASAFANDFHILYHSTKQHAAISRFGPPNVRRQMVVGSCQICIYYIYIPDVLYFFSCFTYQTSYYHLHSTLEF